MWGTGRQGGPGADTLLWEVPTMSETMAVVGLKYRGPVSRRRDAAADLRGLPWRSHRADPSDHGLRRSLSPVSAGGVRGATRLLKASVVSARPLPREKARPLGVPTHSQAGRLSLHSSTPGSSP